MRDPFYDEISFLSLLGKCAELEEKMMTRNTSNILRGEVLLYQVARKSERQTEAV